MLRDFFVCLSLFVDEEKNGTIFLQKSVAKEGTASIMATVLFCFLDFFFLYILLRSSFIVSTCRRVIVK